MAGNLISGAAVDVDSGDQHPRVQKDERQHRLDGQVSVQLVGGRHALVRHLRGAQPAPLVRLHGRVQQVRARPQVRERGGQRDGQPAVQPVVPQRGLQGQLDVRLARTSRTPRLRQLQTGETQHAARQPLQRLHPPHGQELRHREKQGARRDGNYAKIYLFSDF